MVVPSWHMGYSLQRLMLCLRRELAPNDTEQPGCTSLGVVQHRLKPGICACLQCILHPAPTLCKWV